MKQSLIIYMADGSTRNYPVEKPVIKIGRASDNDIVLASADRSVSRWHAAITSNGDGSVFVEDLNSSNGTLLNGRAINAPSRFTTGDIVSLGEFRIRLFDDAPADSGFSIEAGNIELNELQQKPELLPLSGSERTAIIGLKNVELLYEVGVTLARSHSIAEVSNAAVELLFKIDQVHRAAVILWDEKNNSFARPELHMRNVGKTSQAGGSLDPTKLVMSRTILNRVRQQNRPLLIRDAKSDDSSIDNALSIVRAGIQAAFCSPLSFQGHFLGILYADNLAQPDAFSEGDFRTFASIAAQTGLALANAIANDQLLEREVERQALKRYLPPQVANLILESGGASRLNGELQPVTVLYADIRGFTTMSERMDAREIVTILREFFSVMSTAILDCNGTLDKFIGDCIMALFGAPFPSEDAVSDAVRAATLMQRKMSELNRGRAEQNLAPLHIGIGLHSGPAVVGNIGSSDRVQYTAIGDTVNVAARLVSKAAASQIIVSEDVRNALPDYAGFEPLGEVELKGRAGKLHIFSVKWAEQHIQ
jgi:adenylate cyclase